MSSDVLSTSAWKTGTHMATTGIPIRRALATAMMAGGLWWALTYLAAPAGWIDVGESLAGRRYVSASPNLTNTWLIPDALRAAQLFTSLPYVFAAWLVLGLASLGLALRYRGSRTALAAIFTLAALAGASSQTYGLKASVWLIMAAALAALAALLGSHRTRIDQVARQVHSIPWSSAIAIWCTWFLLVAIGVVWLGDLASRGPVALRFLGIRQLDALWMCSFLVIPVTAWSARICLSALALVSALWETRRGPVVLLLAFALSLSVLVWAGSRAKFGSQTGYPHVSAEFVRLICSLALAWLMARYQEWGLQRASFVRASAIPFVVFTGGLAVLVLTRDLGPVLALSLALVPTILAFLGSAQKSPLLTASRWALLAASWLVVALAIRFLFSEWLPHQQWAPERLVLRQEALEDPFRARLDYAAQISWLLEAAGSAGFGLGSVPWCGARAWVGLGACTNASGVPVQFGSDYVFTALVAIWGGVGAVMILTASAVLILAVLTFAARRSAVSGPELSAARLHAWIVVILAAMLMGQLLVSIAGNLGFIPLSGITQPFLGLGTASLAMTAMWIGLAVGQVQRAVDHGRWLSPTLGRYVVGVCIGLVGFVAVSAAWRWTSHDRVSDRLIPSQVVAGLQSLNARILAENSSTDLLATEAVAPFTVDSEDCQTSAQRLNQLVRLASQRVQLQFMPGSLTCGEATSVLAASRWILNHSKDDAVRQLSGKRPRDIGTTNPYRLPGCVRLADEGDERSVLDGATTLCAEASAAAHGVLGTSPRLRQAVASMTTPVRDNLGATESWVLREPVILPAQMAPVPGWAAHLGLDHLVSLIAETRVPRPTRFGQGQSVMLTVEQGLQASAQRLVDCYVGPCELLQPRETRGDGMLEGARARMASLLMVDISTGHIEAAASASSDCYSEHHLGRSKPGCVQLPQPAGVRPWKLTNQALHGDAMCGSLCKLQQGLALLQTDSPLVNRKERLLRAIRESRTGEFIDEFLCADKQFDAACVRTRLQALVKSTEDLGGVSACTLGIRDCRDMDLLGASQLGRFTVSRQRILSNPVDPSRSLVIAQPPGSARFRQEAMRTCYASGDAKRWRSCDGEGLVAHVAELFGQGNATTSPAGVAQALVTLAASANASPAPSVPLLSLIDAGGKNAAENRVAPAHARRLLEALTEPVKHGGTAHFSCLQAMRGDELLNCSNSGQWVMAAKTGTPLFPHDAITHAQRKQHCDAVLSSPPSVARRHEVARCLVPPIKWFALLLGKRDGDHVVWSKAIVVLAERNWSAWTGRVDSPYDRGGNVAAEIGLRMARMVVEPTGSKVHSKAESHAIGQ